MFLAPALLALAAPSATPIPQGTVVRSLRASHPRTDTSADVTVVTAEDLARTGERSLPRQLAKAAGVWVQETNLGGGSPLVQGLSGNQVLLVVDGVRLNDATTRNGVNQMLNGIDPATVERIEVLRGPRSVLYGSDALGGVVLVWTKRSAPTGEDEARALGVRLDTKYESPTQGLPGALGVSGATRRHGWLGIVGAHDWDDLRTADGEADFTGYGGKSGFAAWEMALDAQRSLRTTASVTRDDDVPRTDRLVAGFGQTNPANSEFDYRVQDRRRFVVAYEDREGGALADRVQARVSLRRYEEERLIRAFGSSTRRVERDVTESIGLGIDAQKALDDVHLVTYGVDVDHDDVDSTRRNVNLGTGVSTPGAGSFAPGSRFTSTGAFVQDEMLDVGGFDVTLGARWAWYAFEFEDEATSDEVDGTFDALSGSASVGRDVSDTFRVVGTLARGFRAPNLSELARDATFASGVELRNPDLDPETSLYGELALEHHVASTTTALALFANRIEDVVGRVLADEGGPGLGDETFLRQNIGRLDVIGAQLRTRTALGGSDSPWSASGAIEWTYGVQHDDYVDPGTGEKPFDGEPGQRIPPLHGFAALRHERELGPIDWIELTGTFAFAQTRLAPQDLDDPRIDPDGTDGWTKFDLDFGAPLGERGSSWAIGVHNLFNESYRVHGSGIDGPGIGLVVSVSAVW